MHRLVVVLLGVAACAHGSAENAKTTPAQQQRMWERAVEEETNAPLGARITGRHGPRACYERWVYASEGKFDTCVLNWRNTERQRAAGYRRGPTAQQVVQAITSVAQQASSPRRLVCLDHTL